MKKLLILLLLIPSLSWGDLMGIEDLLKDGYKIIFSNENDKREISFILEKKNELYLCKINNYEYIPTNRGCFPFPLNEAPLELDKL